MYVIAHHDIPQCFEHPTQVHAYVDDIALVYIPSIHLKFSSQAVEIEERINNDMTELLNYADKWHQPLNPNKT
ncbi:unnamed protein product, partial [Rotaria magnacalcarata]